MFDAPPPKPGFYPAPDGAGERWWNGAGWSDARRNAPPSAPSPAPIAPMTPLAGSSKPAGRRRSPGGAIAALVLAALAFAWWPFAIIGFFAAIGVIRGSAAARNGLGVLFGLLALGLVLFSATRWLPALGAFFDAN